MSRNFVLSFLVGSLLAVSTASAADDSAAGQTVYLTVREPEVAGPAGGIPPMAVREVIRQALLVAARDELGLSTRDAMLREDFPEKPDEKSVPFEMFCRTIDPVDDRQLEFVLTRRGAPDKVLWRRTFTTQQWPPGELSEKAEALARGELKDVLIRAGFKGSVPAARATSDVPSETYDLLWTWNEISVMAGLRRVHKEIREKGESPELLAALAVGYANLGSLTEYHLSAEPKVYYARSLVYEERLSFRAKDSPWALWNSAYVAMQVGAHTGIAQTIAAARKNEGDSAPAKPLPFFAKVTEAFGKGDLQGMVKNATTPPERRLARYLHWQAVMFGPLVDLKLETTRALLRECPDCPRAYDSLVVDGELGPARVGAEAGFSVTSGLLHKRLVDVPGLPQATVKRIRDSDATQDVAAEVEFHKDIVADLKKAGDPGIDRGEPSLSALGHMIEEIELAQVIRRLEFYARDLGVPVDDMLASYGPLVATHPYGELINSYATARNKGAQEVIANALVSKIDLPALTLKNRAMVQWVASVTGLPRLHDWYQVPGQHCDMIFIDMLRGLDAGLYGPPNDPKYNIPAMGRLVAISDNLPVVIGMRITRDWERTKAEAKEFERKYADDPIVMSALADRYYVLKRYDDAERCAKRLVEIHPGYPAYRLLGRIYKATKNRVKWRETLDKAIELPSHGLEQARVQDQIAQDLLEHKEFKEAATYADAAAESYSAWSMLTAARCHEMLADWKKAEQYVKAVSERYEDSFMTWIRWCYRTGHGDFRAAEEFTRQHIEAWGTNLDAHHYRHIADFYLLTGEPAKALFLFKRIFDENQSPYAGFHAALIADTLGKSEDRDKFLHQVIDAKAKDASVTWGIQIYQPLARLFQEMLPPKQAKQLNVAEVEKLAKDTSQYPGCTLPYAVGVFLKNRGDVEGAKKYLIRAAQAVNWGELDYSMACQLLREMKVEVPQSP